MRALVLLLLATAMPGHVHADDVVGTTKRDDKPKTKPKKTKDAAKPAEPKPEPAPAPPRKPGPDDAKAVAILEKIIAGTDSAAREVAIAELDKVAPHAVDAVGEWLVGHAHQVADPDRRKVLLGIKAAVPDKTGRFATPDRASNKDLKTDDQLDWLKMLLAKAQDNEGEVIADVAAIHALAKSNDPHAAQYLFDAAFLSDTIIYRDDCGRWLRHMEPYSIPVLTAESQNKNFDRKRYGTWQLERLDRQDPNKALAAAMASEAVQVATLDVFRMTHHREAVHAVWSYVNADAPRVRAAARAAWMDYITGPPPPPAPRQKLNLPGGKLTKYPKPLWLTYRELADNELRKAANELLHEDYPLADPNLDDNERTQKTVKIDLEDVTKRLFAYYDGERTKRDTAQWEAAKAKADKGELVTATAMLDRLITTNPDRAERIDMARVYEAYGKQLEATQKWSEASAAYSKAHGLDPKATHALAAQHYTLGKSLEAAGKDGGPDFRRAVALDPEYAPAKTAADHVSAARPVWMLYAAIGAGTFAMLLFAAAMMRRRA